ncbi:flagellar motor switch protein FliN [Treponema sp.]|uniref:flagellar motor switch protein FliN n=1 Tax=Treponema sp. TaxID=166 RepID=UPI00298EB35A|nr:flagellar motor switch protein FliN [Treponema sp.]MCR5613426.1 flagellar motor switch protein FliN [Treponema sp.]
MSDGAISQDEIDALLSGVPIDGLNASGQVSNGPSVTIDAVALGKFADELKQPLADNFKQMTGVDCSASNVVVESCVRDQLLAKLPEMVIAVMADFSNALTGDHIYIISTELAQKLVSLINKEENAALDDMSLSIISETLSTHTNDEITALDKTQKFAGLACNPAEAVNIPKAMVRIPQNTFALFSYPITLDGQSYTIWEAIAGEAAVQIAKAYGSEPEAASGSGLSAADMASMQSLAGGMPMGGQPQMGMGQMGMPGMGMGQMGMPGMGMGQPMMGGGMPMMGGGMPMNTPNVQALQYPNLQGGMAANEQGNISLIMDVFMEMTVELGRTKKQIRDILGMGEGTIIELDKLAGEPVDILVNHKPIAKGEVVVIDENFGVRVTEILSPLERVSDLH